MKHQNYKWNLLGSITHLSSIAVLLLTTLTWASSSENQSIKSHTDLFPRVSCNVLDQMEDSRELLSEKHSLVRPQGIFPWPDVGGHVDINGIWFNSSRGTYVVLKQVEHPRSPKHGALHIKFYSACTHALMAEGIRVLTPKDWESNTTYISLRNQELNGKRLRAQVTIHLRAGGKNQDYIEIVVYEPNYGERDHFYMGRFQ